MILFLTSSPTGPLDGSRPVYGLDETNQFLSNLRRYWPDKARCLIIAATPGDARGNDQMREFFEGAVKRSGLDCKNFDLWDDRTTDVSKETLHSYDVIWLGGGHVPTENAYFQKIQLREKIQDFPGIIIGISAGTMNCADVVYAQPELPGESIRPDYQRFLPGLGVTRINILPHYQMVKDWYLDGKKLYPEITYQDSIGKVFLVLNDGSYLMREGQNETVWGQSYIIADGTIRQLCQDNQWTNCPL